MSLSNSYATPIPGDTYAERALAGTLSLRTDSSGLSGNVIFTSTATPLVSKGALVYNNGILRLNVGTQTVPIWRTITNG